MGCSERGLYSTRISNLIHAPRNTPIESPAKKPRLVLSRPQGKW